MLGRKRGSRLAAGLAAAIVTGAAPACADDIIWGRPGADAAAIQLDAAACLRESHLVGVMADMSRTSITTPGGQAVGMLFGAGFSAALKPKAQASYAKSCMSGRGNLAVTLTPREAADLKAQSTPQARATWTDALYHSPDFATRLAALAPPPPLPPPPETPREAFTIGAVRLDPATLTVAGGELHPIQAILSGPITHRRTGRVTATQGFNGYGVAQGLVVQAAVVQGPQGRQTYWCGKVSKSWPLDGYSDHCLWSDGRDVLVFPGRDASWLDRPTFNDEPGRQASASFSVTESPDDLIGPMAFGLYLEKVTDQGVRVTAQAALKGKFIDFWSADLPFDAEGRAVLPFWTHRLLLRRSGAGVTASLTPDGDGAGWEALPDTTAR